MTSIFRPLPPDMWLCLHLPSLSLETFRPCWSDAGLYAVVDCETILMASDMAVQHGVRIGMRRTGARIIAPGLVLLERDLSKEQEALDSVALTLLQYTPEVTFAEKNSILLDVKASLSAFGGRLALCRRVAKSIAVLGFTAQIGCAPTARGAWLLAQHKEKCIRRTIKMSSMIKHLDRLPCTLFPAAHPHQDWLRGIGCRSIGDLRKLPRAGLQRRTSPNLLAELDQAFGMALELFEWVKAPETFNVKLELPDRIDYAEALLFAARRLIVQMVGWLVSLQKAVSHIVLWLTHERGRCAIPPTPMEIRLAEPTWQEGHIVRLLKEQLNKAELVAPVIAIRLETKLLSEMLVPTQALFPEPGGTPADFGRLLELLKARLGEDGVLSPAPIVDYRPEVSNQWVPATTFAKGKADRVVSKCSNRPCFLLAEPIALLVRNHQPFYGSPLELIQGPQRIEAGWWDEKLAVRDYFIARSSDAICYWIYQKRNQQNSWFLHGLFG